MYVSIHIISKSGDSYTAQVFIYTLTPLYVSYYAHIKLSYSCKWETTTFLKWSLNVSLSLGTHLTVISEKWRPGGMTVTNYHAALPRVVNRMAAVQWCSEHCGGSLGLLCSISPCKPLMIQAQYLQVGHRNLSSNKPEQHWLCEASSILLRKLEMWFFQFPEHQGIVYHQYW